MGSQDFEVELASLDRAVGLMSSQVVDEMTALSGDWTRYLQGLDRTAWSTEDACQDFGTAYLEAVEAYDQVLQGVKQDVVRYRDELHATVEHYRGHDDWVQGEMNRQIGGFGAVSSGDRMGQIAYDQRRTVLDDQNSGPAPAPADTSPGK